MAKFYIIKQVTIVIPKGKVPLSAITGALEMVDEVGYSNDEAFREIFRKMTGLLPLEYMVKFAVEENCVTSRILTKYFQISVQFLKAAYY